jgi:hypothetical protein
MLYLRQVTNKIFAGEILEAYWSSMMTVVENDI